ncbi:hypothetical protein THRCLA_20594 [Thraustotheca clavata]|uniref:Uncharacterized protein n=1 Tax=Thraustotheca clavata TaxID=74557 RepID=A0A1W0A5F8_9STRA|nr:hypothetical protein THRCLA_20594 [Thraustotheca clavata]
MNNVVLRIITCDEVLPSAWNELLCREDGRAIANELLKHLPFAPLLDRVTPAIESFIAKYPTTALELLSTLMVLKNVHCDVSGLRSWVLHVVQLTKLTDVPGVDVKSFMVACNSAKMVERERILAVKLDAMQKRLEKKFDLDPLNNDAEKKSDILVFLDAIRIDRNSSLKTAIEFVALWPKSESLLKDEYAAVRFKMQTIRFPARFYNLLHHFIAMKYITRTQAYKKLIFSPPLHVILQTALPIVPRLGKVIDTWLAQSCLTQNQYYVRLQLVPCIWTDQDDATKSLNLSLSHIHYILDEMNGALQICHESDASVILLGLFFLLKFQENLPDSPVAKNLKIMLDYMKPVGFDDIQNRTRICVVLSFLRDIASWQWLWKRCPGLLPAAALKIAKLAQDTDDPNAKWLIKMAVKSLVLECKDSIQIAEAAQLASIMPMVKES